MFKAMTIVLALALGSAALAADSQPQSAKQQVQISREGDYVIVRRPMRLTFDVDQQKALASAGALVQAQLNKITTQNVLDPNGDLQALADAAGAIDRRVDQLVQTAQKLYGNARMTKMFEPSPSAIMVFGSVAGDVLSWLNLLKAGGSGTVGFVIMPMREVRYNMRDRSQKPIERIHLDINTVLIGVLNAGGKAAIAEAQQKDGSGRIGVGLVWGEMNSAKDLHGTTYGGSYAVSFGAGMNLKLLGVTNSEKSGVANTILMAGIERGDIKVEPRANLGYIWDVGSAAGGVSDFISNSMKRISGQPDPQATR